MGGVYPVGFVVYLEASTGVITVTGMDDVYHVLIRAYY